jgi:hypothetical protein
MQIVDDEAGQPLVMHEQALPDRIRVLPRYRDRLLEDLVRSDAPIDIGLDEADPIPDDLGLLLEVGLAAGLAVAGHDRLDIEGGDPVEGSQPLPRVAFLHPGAAFVEHIVAGEDDALLRNMAGKNRIGPPQGEECDVLAVLASASASAPGHAASDLTQDDRSARQPRFQN